MSTQLEAARTELMKLIDEAADLSALDAVRVSALGKKGRVTALMQGLKDVATEARKEAGQALNRLKGKTVIVSKTLTERPAETKEK